MPEIKKTYDKLIARVKEISLLQSCQSVLWWDERVNLPAKGGKHRGDQLSLLAGMVHEKFTSPEIGAMLEKLQDSELAQSGDTEEAANIREIGHQYYKKIKISKEWVEKFSRASTISQGVWVEARKENDFLKFLPHLKKIIQFKKEYTEMIGYEKHSYDALLDDYETGSTIESIDAVFSAFRNELVEFVARIKNSSVCPDRSIMKRKYPVDKQQQFGLEASAAIGFDYQAGRLDVTAHPFCSGFGPGDTRITTRFFEDFFPSAYFGIMHEAGHGIYNQGFLPENYGTPMAEGVSHGIHESQSRLWENMVGRNRQSWKFFYPRARHYFGDTLAGVSEDEFYFAINDVKPSLIRVEADEVTYNLHIILRYELEQLFMKDELKAEDIPTAWNEKFHQFFGITPPDDADGCMQDIHWSAGYIGYFPSYAMGNLYAAQFFARAGEDIPGLQDMFAEGKFAPLKIWLNEKIYRHGKRYRSNRLIEKVTGKPFSHQPLMDYLRDKFSPLYQL